MVLRPPVEPMLAQAAEAIPPTRPGAGVAYEQKFDGHRMVAVVEAETVVLYARSGRVVTSAWMDLALEAHRDLRAGTVLDGEAVI